jgi:NAD(P)-dependent dehydrogenase (short-subunit alcohol dehydrogenase family)
MNLDGSVIVVTGASSGIGLTIAHALVDEGARVVFTARSRERLEAEVKKATARGGDAIAVSMDVTSDDSVSAALEVILARFGRIDVVVNDAGNAGEMNLWSAMSPQIVRETFDVHLHGTERVMRAVLPTMQRQRSGTIVNFASTVAWVPMPGAAAYSAAKAAVVSLSEALREELRSDGVDVRVFAPPHTSTEAGKRMPLDLPKIFAPEWVAAEFIAFLRGTRARALPGGNGMLLLVQRFSPRLASRIMNKLGFNALSKVLRGDLPPPPALSPPSC